MVRYNNTYEPYDLGSSEVRRRINILEIQSLDKRNFEDNYEHFSAHTLLK